MGLPAERLQLRLLGPTSIDSSSNVNFLFDGRYIVYDGGDRPYKHGFFSDLDTARSASHTLKRPATDIFVELPCRSRNKYTDVEITSSVYVT